MSDFMTPSPSELDGPNGSDGSDKPSGPNGTNQLNEIPTLAQPLPGEITSVNKAAWHLIQTTYRSRSIAFLVFAAVVFLISPITGIGILGAYFLYVYIKAAKYFMQTFALTHNLHYSETAPLESFSGYLFDNGDSQHISNVMSGTYHAHPLRFFHFNYSEGSTKNKTNYRFTAIEFSFEKTVFPYILLRSRSMPVHSAPENGKVKISLEEQFKKHYELYTREGYEIEVFEIFTPEVLQMLTRECPELSIEFAGNNMYIYDNLYMFSSAKLEKFYESSKRILDRIGPLLNRLHDDFAALHPYLATPEKR